MDLTVTVRLTKSGSSVPFTSQNRSTDVCHYHYMSTNPVLLPVLFSRLGPDSGKLLPTFVIEAVITLFYVPT